MTDTAKDARESVHDLRGDALAQYIASHIALWGYPPLAGGAPDDGEDDDDQAARIAELEQQLEASNTDRDKWKGLSKKHEKRAKDNEDAATKLEQLEQSGKSESQKATDTAAKETKRADEAESRATRLEVALDKAPAGMPLSQVRKLAKRLTGSNREELESDAAELFADFTPKKDDAGGDDDGGSGGGKDEDDSPGRRRPTERLKSGAAPAADSDDSETDPEKLAAKVPRLN